MATPTIILFQNTNFGGDALVIRDFDQNLSRDGFNDRTSSLIVIDGEWELSQNSDYGGEQWGPVSSNGGPSGNGLYPRYTDWHGKNDSISSLRSIG